MAIKDDLKHLKDGNPAKFRLAVALRTIRNSMDHLKQGNVLTTENADAKFASSIANAQKNITEHAGGELTEDEIAELLKHAQEYVKGKDAEVTVTAYKPELAKVRASGDGKTTTTKKSGTVDVAKPDHIETLSLSDLSDLMSGQAKLGDVARNRIATLETNIATMQAEIVTLREQGGKLDEGAKLAARVGLFAQKLADADLLADDPELVAAEKELYTPRLAAAKKAYADWYAIAFPATEEGDKTDGEQGGQDEATAKDGKDTEQGDPTAKDGEQQKLAA